MRREGNESLAILLEQERLELVAVVEELQSAIEELVEAYRMEVEALALEAEEEMRGLSDEFDAEYEEIWELSKKIGGGTGTGNVHQIHVHQTAAKKEAALRKRYERLLARVERSAGREITGQFRLLERDVKSEGRDAMAQGVDSEATARLDLRATFSDFLTRIQELEIEKAQALRDLEEEYGTLSISGFKHWLASGGLVSGAVGGKAGIRKFAEGGHVPLNVGTPGKDSVPAWLMPGEFVLKERVVRTLGLPVLQAVNRMDASLLDSFKSVQKFASGGLVGGAAASLPSTSTGGDMEDFGHPDPEHQWLSVRSAGQARNSQGAAQRIDQNGKEQQMSDFTAIRDSMRPRTQGLRLGVVEKVLDPARLVVRFSSGALRRVYVNGNAMPAVGTDVLVRGETLVGRARGGKRTTMTII